MAATKLPRARLVVDMKETVAILLPGGESGNVSSHHTYWNPAKHTYFVVEHKSSRLVRCSAVKFISKYRYVNKVIY